MNDNEHIIAATYIGDSKKFRQGQHLVLHVSHRAYGLYPITVVYRYKAIYTSIPYRSIVEFLRDWTDIVTVIDPEKVEKADKGEEEEEEEGRVVWHEGWQDDPPEDELPFTESPFKEESTQEREYRLPVPLVSRDQKNALGRIPPKTVFSNGAWVCPYCHSVNHDADALKCAYCLVLRAYNPVD